MKKQNVMLNYNTSRHDVMKMSRRKKFIRIVRICSFILFFSSMILFSEKSYNILNAAIQQQITITGTVTDSNGEPLPGVSVMVKGTSQGTITDVNGKFTFNVSGDKPVLQISYIGYLTQEIEVDNRTSFEITLSESTLEMDEVIVIGYGTAKRRDVTGSVVRADLDKLRESPNISVGQALQGTIPGLNVGATGEAGKDPTISIRGRNSISGSTSPLIVLDGMIYRGNLVDINPNDIESIDILKDASAAAIYGSQASNGVMLITSKSVKAMSKPIIEYSGIYTLQTLTTDKMRPMNREGFLQMVADRWIDQSRTGDDLLQPNPIWDPSRYMMDNNAVNGYNNGVDTDWWDIGTIDNPYIQSHNLSVRGRSELSSYFLSMGLTDQENYMRGDVYKRYNVRLNLDTRITNWFKIGTQSFFTVGDWSGARMSNQDTQLPPVCPERDASGELIIFPYKNTLNPSLTLQQDNVNKRLNLFGNFYADIDIPFIKGLSYRINFSQNLIIGKVFNFNPWDQNLTGRGQKDNNSTYNWSADNILSYNNTFGRHSINSTLAYGAEKREFESTMARGTNYDNDLLGFNYLQAASASLQVIESNAWKEASLFAMFRLNYSLDGKYSITGTVRRDGFSGFGKENKFAVFPSVAAAWHLGEERFIKDNLKWIDNLKLRLSYGSNGNRSVSRYQTLARVQSLNAYLYGDGSQAEKGIERTSMANNDLKWETTNSFNAGMDISVFNSRLSGVLEFYRSNTHDLLYNINIPRMNNNLDVIATNIGKLSNYGFEMALTGIPVQTKDFSWNITFNYSINRNKVVSILGLDNDGDGKEDDLVASKIFIGHPYGVCYDFDIIGMWQVSDYRAGNIPTGFYYGTYKVADLNNDGNYSAADDRKILGYTDPSYRFSIENVLRYKNWELKMFINSIQGGKDYYYEQPGRRLANPDNIYQNNSFKFDYWTPENPNARYRQIGMFSPVLGNEFSPYIQRSFVRLQNLTLSYRLPSTILKKIGINNFKIYATGTNLLTFTDWDGWDPETSTGLGYREPNSSGLDGDYPLMRTYSIGINFDF